MNLDFAPADAPYPAHEVRHLTEPAAGEQP